MSDPEAIFSIWPSDLPLLLLWENGRGGLPRARVICSQNNTPVFPVFAPTSNYWPKFSVQSISVWRYCQNSLKLGIFLSLPMHLDFFPQGKKLCISAKKKWFCFLFRPFLPSIKIVLNVISVFKASKLAHQNLYICTYNHHSFYLSIKLSLSLFLTYPSWALVTPACCNVFPDQCLDLL